MKKHYIGKETLNILGNAQIELKYFVLETELTIDSTKMKNYGIEIEKQDITKIEKGRISNITTDQIKINDIVKTLMKNEVTPIHLHDVIEDML